MVAQIDRNFIRTRPWKIWPRLVAYLMFEGRPLTTRGRWINPLVFAGFRLWSMVPSRQTRSPIFILGVGRSGTTVLGKILSMHPDVGYLNEPKALWQSALGDDDLIGSYGNQPGRYRMGPDAATLAKSQKLHRLYNAFLGLSFSRRVVDKYPELLFRSGLIDAIFPDARKILLVRNGADICQSVAGWNDTHGNDRDSWWGRDRQKWNLLVRDLVAPDPYFDGARRAVERLQSHVDMAAVEWIVSMREALRLLDNDNSSMALVRYEDLVKAPSAVMSQICQFCNLEHDAKMQNYAKGILTSRPAYPQPKLHPEIQPLFDQTMRKLGYLA